MGRLRAVGYGIVVSLLAGAATMPVFAAPRGAVGLPALAATTRLAGSRPGVVEVVVPRDASISNPFVTGRLGVEGPGRFVGFALVSEQRDRSGRPVTLLLGGRLPVVGGPRPFVFDAQGFADTTTRRYEVKAGRYLLYLLPGRGKSSVTIHLHGLSGHARLSPVRDVAYKVTSLEGPSAAAAYTGAASASLSGEGLIFQTTWFENEAHAATKYDACVWRGKARQPWADAPECGDVDAVEAPGLRASKGTIDYGSSLGDNVRVYYGAWLSSTIAASPNGVFGQSFDLQTTAAVDSLGSLAIWLRF